MTGRSLARLVATLGLLAACSPRSGPPLVVQPPVGGLAARLEESSRDLPDHRIAWQTWWELCWSDYPGARAYEIQSLTGEGASSKLRRQTDRCFRLEVAAGENDRAAGLLNRDVQLALESGQIAYRVRAVLDGNRVSEWSAAVAAGRSPSGSPAAGF